MTEELLKFDLSFAIRQNFLLAGADEAGRGPLAGPVVCAACIMPLNSFIDGINDSKQLSETKREALYDRITATALAYCTASVTEAEIDLINILNATKKGMSAAISGLRLMPDLVLVDAVKGLDTKAKTVPIIRGDAQSYNIAAASILAKVTRDRIMRGYDKLYPGYYFEKNKGYGTPEHIAALKEKGASVIHRRSFIKNFIGEAEQPL